MRPWGLSMKTWVTVPVPVWLVEQFSEALVAQSQPQHGYLLKPSQLLSSALALLCKHKPPSSKLQHPCNKNCVWWRALFPQHREGDRALIPSCADPLGLIGSWSYWLVKASFPDRFCLRKWRWRPFHEETWWQSLASVHTQVHACAYTWTHTHKCKTFQWEWTQIDTFTLYVTLKWLLVLYCKQSPNGNWFFRKARWGRRCPSEGGIFLFNVLGFLMKVF